MKAYSEDLRQKIVAVVGRGMPKTKAAHLFGVSLSSVKRYVRMAREGGSLTPKRRSGRTPKIGKYAKKLLEADMRERPAATIADRRRFLERITGIHLSESTVWRALKRLGWSRKKERACNGKGRMAKSRLAGEGCREARREAVGVRR